MPPKARIKKEDVLRKALKLVQKGGIDALTAKALAKELGCSTQPVFWLYENMGEVKEAVFAEASKLFGEALRKETDGNNPYKAVGVNYINFASEEPELFKLLYMSERSDKENLLTSDASKPFIMEIIARNETFEEAEAERVFEEMWLFSHGIATMIVCGTASFTAKQIEDMLGDVYRGLVLRLGKRVDGKDR